MSKFVPVPTHTLKLASRALRTVTASNGKVVWFQDGKLQALDPNDKFKILISVFVACPPNAAMPTYFCTLSIAERFLAINGSNEPFLQDRTQYFFQGLALSRSIFVCVFDREGRVAEIQSCFSCPSSLCVCCSILFNLFPLQYFGSNEPVTRTRVRFGHISQNI
jgi:hypothetical protein